MTELSGLHQIQVVPWQSEAVIQPIFRLMKWKDDENCCFQPKKQIVTIAEFERNLLVSH